MIEAEPLAFVGAFGKAEPFRSSGGEAVARWATGASLSQIGVGPHDLEQG